MKVLVLMSTYNGEKYLREQIDSILAQEGVEVYLLVRDDGSRDNTCEILDEYARKYENIEVVKAENVGFVKSFSKLVEMAQDYKVHADYYAFSDQDDVWMPHKLKTACDQLAKMDKDKPLLFSSNSILVDSHLNEIKKFHEKEPYRTKENVMIYPTEQGCSMVFNKKVVELYSKYPPTGNVPHDRWLHMICAFLGYMYYEHLPLFYYRLHEDNTIGLETGCFNRIINDLVFFVKTKSKHQDYSREFAKSFSPLMSEEMKSAIDVYLDYPSVFKFKLNMIFNVNYSQSLDVWNRVRKSILILFNKV